MGEREKFLALMALGNTVIWAIPATDSLGGKKLSLL